MSSGYALTHSPAIESVLGQFWNNSIVPFLQSNGLVESVTRGVGGAVVGGGLGWLVDKGIEVIFGRKDVTIARNLGMGVGSTVGIFLPDFVALGNHVTAASDRAELVQKAIQEGSRLAYANQLELFELTIRDDAFAFAAACATILKKYNPLEQPADARLECEITLAILAAASEALKQAYSLGKLPIAG